MDQRGLKLTDELIAALQPQATTAVLWDTEVVNFGVEITPDGASAFLVEFPGARGAKRQVIGRTGVLDVETAREQARARLREAAVSQPVRPSMTVAELCDLYLEEGLLTRKPQTFSCARSSIENHIKPLLGWKPLAGLEPADGHGLLRQVAAGKTSAKRRGCRDVTGGRSAANQALSVLAAALSFAVRRGELRANPLRGIRRFPLNRPGRPLTPEEYQRLGQAIAVAARLGLESTYALAGIQLLMLTGCRRGEIQSLTWDAVDRTRGRFHLKDTKSGEASIPVGPEVFAVLDAIPSPARPSRYVLPADNKDGHVSLRRPWLRLRTVAGLPQLRMHDLRHAFAAVMLSHNETIPTVGKVLGHRNSASTERYKHVTDAAASRAAAAACAEVAGAANSSLHELLARGGDAPIDALPAADAERYRAVLVQAMASRWLTTAQAAARTGLSQVTLQQLRSARQGPAYGRVGCRIVYSEADIEAWMAERRAAAELDKSFRRSRAKRRASAAPSRAPSGLQKLAARKDEGRA